MRTPPHNIDAEQAVLGAILVNNDSICNVNLQPNEFFKDKHKMIFMAMQKLYGEAKEIDAINIADYFKGDLQQIGGFSYLADLATSAIKLDKHKVEIIRETARLRKLIILCNESMEKAYNNEVSNAIMESIQGDMAKFTTGEHNYITDDKKLVSDTLQMIEDNHNNGGKVLGMTTGIKSLDIATNGLQDKLYVLAGRPGMGKSALAINIAHNVSKDKRVAYFSIEMGAKEIGLRRLAMAGLMHHGNLKKGDLDDEGWKKLMNTAAKVSSYNTITNCKPSISISEIRNECIKIKLQGGLDMIVVDHIGLVNASLLAKETREQITKLCIIGKEMSKEFEIPVVFLSQLSRSCEARANKRPMLSDLKESGGIEENADCVMLLYRDEYYNPETSENNIIECNIAKQRDGSTGTLKLAWVPEYQLIADIARV